MNGALRCQVVWNLAMILIVVEAVYHKRCYTKFTMGFGSAAYPSVEYGRRVDGAKMNAFEKLCTRCTLLEYSSELYSLSELHNIIVDLAGMANCAYSEEHLQRLLLQKYNGNVVLCQMAGKNNRVPTIL